MAFARRNARELVRDPLTVGFSLGFPLVLLALFAVKSVTIVVYGALLYAASGILFPLPAALAVNLLGTIIMITIPYLIGSASGSEAIRRIAADQSVWALFE